MQVATPVFDRIETLRLPVIAAVNGFALAGGLELLLCCDLIVADASARIGDGHARFGLVPGGGSGVRLTQRLGPLRARELLFTGEALPADQLLAMGLVNRGAGGRLEPPRGTGHDDRGPQPLGIAMSAWSTPCPCPPAMLATEAQMCVEHRLRRCVGGLRALPNAASRNSPAVEPDPAAAAGASAAQS
jgi:hypothetical protein